MEWSGHPEAVRRIVPGGLIKRPPWLDQMDGTETISSGLAGTGDGEQSGSRHHNGRYRGQYCRYYVTHSVSSGDVS